jgi:tRNA/rRNA methyltransferase
MNIRFILVEPKVPENIGASARALKTMGFNRLDFVNPAEWREGKAVWVAHGSAELLENAKIYNSLREAISENEFVIGTTAKTRSVKEDYLSVDELYSFLSSRSGVLNEIVVVFGREESGLTNEEIGLCDLTTSVPMAGLFPSLNLAQAVMIYAWELSGLKTVSRSDSNATEISSLKAMKEKARRFLPMIGIEESDNMYGRIMERLTLAQPDDLNLLHSVFTAAIQKLETHE